MESSNATKKSIEMHMYKMVAVTEETHPQSDVLCISVHSIHSESHDVITPNEATCTEHEATPISQEHVTSEHPHDHIQPSNTPSEHSSDENEEKVKGNRFRMCPPIFEQHDNNSEDENKNEFENESNPKTSIMEEIYAFMDEKNASDEQITTFTEFIETTEVAPLMDRDDLIAFKHYISNNWHSKAKAPVDLARDYFKKTFKKVELHPDIFTFAIRYHRHFGNDDSKKKTICKLYLLAFAPGVENAHRIA